MLCFVINKDEYEKIDINYINKHTKFVCIGSIKEIEEAYDIARLIPCLTEVKILDNHINACCYIICQP